MTSLPSDRSDPASGADVAACADLARWCDDADVTVRRDGRALARAEQHLSGCAECRNRFGAELRFWAALASPEPASASFTPMYRPPSFASVGNTGVKAPRLKLRARVVATAIIVAVIVVGVRIGVGGPSSEGTASRRAAAESAPHAAPMPSRAPSLDRAQSETDPRFRPQFVTRASTGAPPAPASDPRPSVLHVRAADARPAPVIAQSFSVERRTPRSTSILVLESAARTLAVRAP